MIKEITEKEWTQEIADGFVLVDVYGENCGPCKMLSRVLEEIEFDYPYVTILKLNADRHPEWTQKMNITAVPTLLFYKDGAPVERHAGFLPAEQIMDIAGPHMY